MAEKTVFLAWQDKWVSREWFPIGRLDADVESEIYRFRYIGGAKRAEKEAKISIACSFPSFGGRLQVIKAVFHFQQPGDVA